MAMFAQKDGNKNRVKKRLSKEEFQDLLSKSICDFCEQKGHWAKYCPSKSKPRRDHPKAYKQENNNKRSGDRQKSSTSVALMAKINHTENKEWYADSGASNHMSFDKSIFTVYKKLDHELFILVGDDTSLKVEGIGTVNFSCSLDNARRISLWRTYCTYLTCQQTYSLLAKIHKLEL